MLMVDWLSLGVCVPRPHELQRINYPIVAGLFDCGTNVVNHVLRLDFAFG